MSGTSGWRGRRAPPTAATASTSASPTGPPPANSRYLHHDLEAETNSRLVQVHGAGGRPAGQRQQRARGRHPHRRQGRGGARRHGPRAQLGHQPAAGPVDLVRGGGGGGRQPERGGGRGHQRGHAVPGAALDPGDWRPHVTLTSVLIVLLLVTRSLEFIDFDIDLNIIGKN